MPTTSTLPTPSPAGAMPGLRKAAILLISLGDQVSVEIVRHLTEDELERLGEEIAGIGPVTPEEAEAVLDEFHSMLERVPIGRGGTHFAERLLLGAAGSEFAKRVLDRISRAVAAQAPKVAALRKVDPQALAAVIQNEQPQTIAVILANLEAKQAGSLLMSLPAGKRTEVARRMAAVERVSPDVLCRIADLVGRKIRDQGETNHAPAAGVSGMAEVLSGLGEAVSDELLAAIERVDAQLAGRIRQRMFVFEDILSIDPQSMKALVAKLDRKILTVALKGAGDKMRSHFTQCLSQRGAEMLSEDMEALGPVRIRDVESARQHIIELVKRLEAEGVLSLSAGGNDQYVL